MFCYLPKTNENESGNIRHEQIMTHVTINNVNVLFRAEVNIVFEH